jgi:hypothetical protein
VLPQRPSELIDGHLLVVVLDGQDGDQRLPDLVASLVVRRTGIRRVERLGPVVGAEPDIGPRGLDHDALGGWLLVEPDCRLDRLDLSADALRRTTSGSVSIAARAPSGTRSRGVHVCTPSSPRLGRTSAT